MMFALLIQYLFIVACSDDPASESLPNPNHLLTGEISKEWKIVKLGNATVSPCMEDNIFIYFSNGRVEYEIGSVTSVEGSCSDENSLVGEWQFSNNGDSLITTWLHVQGDPSSTINESGSSYIEFLSADSLVIEDRQLSGSALRSILVPN